LCISGGVGQVKAPSCILSKLLPTLLFFNLSLYSIESAPATQPSQQGSSLLGGFNAGGLLPSLGDLSKLQMMQMFSRQMVSPDEGQRLKFYAPLINYLTHNANPEIREIISREALNMGGVTKTSDFLNNVSIIISNPKNEYIPQADRTRIQNEIANGMISQARDVSGAGWQSFISNAMQIGLAMGIVDCMQKVIGESCTRLVNKVPGVFAFMARIAGNRYNALCNRPDPLQVEEILIWEQSFECMINSLCEQNVSGNLMLKNIRVSEDEVDNQQAVDVNWQFFSQMVKQMNNHIVQYFNDRLPYYTGAEQQRQWLVSIANCLSVESRDSIAFIITMINGNLNQLVEVCERAQTSDELDRVHIKKIGRITLLLFNKLRVLIGGSSQGSANGNSMNSQMGMV
jgi:hypothetical protein